MFKRIMWIGLTLAMLLALTVGGAWLWGQLDAPAAAQGSATEESGYNPAQVITVVGQGSARVEPDIARVSVGVETSAETIAEAVAENEAQMDAVLAALEAAGIAEKDIQTTNYSISLDRYPEPVPATSDKPAQPVYRVSNMVNVTVRDLENVGAVLDAVIEAGANNIWGVSFTVEDPSQAQGEARADAVANARERAEALAELSGVELGPVMSVSEVLSGGGVPMAYDAVIERAAAGSGSISPGELEIGYQVQVSFFIAP